MSKSFLVIDTPKFCEDWESVEDVEKTGRKVDIKRILKEVGG